jgi:5'-methylthioadenosine phosphorylase
MKKNDIKIGIIGGSGLDDPQILADQKLIKVKTPFGFPSEKLVTGKLNNCDVVILARHGKTHSIPPSQVPYQANIWALKSVGCTAILATTACGSLRENMKPGEIVFPDQFIDFTRVRNLSFFTDRVVHTPMADPFDNKLRLLLTKSANELKITNHHQGTIITIEGPRFSTRAESKMFRLWGADLINMSTVPEVVLADELNLPYQTIAMVTDYDCWKDNETTVSFDLIIQRMQENAEKVKKLLIRAIEKLSD